MVIDLHLTSINEETSRESIQRPKAFDAYDLQYYIGGRLVFSVDHVHILNPDWDWPVLYLAYNVSPPYFTDALDRPGGISMDIPEGPYSISLHRSGTNVEIKERLESRTAEVNYDELVDACRRFAEDVRTTLLDMNPQFAEHAEMGEWFRTPQA